MWKNVRKKIVVEVRAGFISNDYAASALTLLSSGHIRACHRSQDIVIVLSREQHLEKRREWIKILICVPFNH